MPHPSALERVFLRVGKLVRGERTGNAAWHRINSAGPRETRGESLVKTQFQSDRQRRVIAFLGSSSTAGRGQAFNWVEELKKRPQNANYEFPNFGVGGDLCENALARLPQVLASRPDRIVIWIGANDVLAIVFSNFYQFARRAKHLGCEPSPEMFARNLRLMADRIASKSGAKLGLCSLAPIGENLTATDPPQSLLNRLIERFNTVIKDVAKQSGATYIPVYEKLSDSLKDCPRFSLTGFRFFPFYHDAFRSVILRLDSDKIAALNGWCLHVDGIHLNRRSGLMVADLMQAFIDAT
jgi:lysophospholipase L1-like esterase